VRRYGPLNERQVEVLRWVADGSPGGVWEDFSYKRTAYALAERGLVVVERRRSFWHATVTDDGRYYLEHGTYRSEKARDPGRRARATPSKPVAGSSSAAARTIDAASLLAEVEAAGGVIRIPVPEASVRGAYRRAISAAITKSLVPDGYGLRHTGRDRGDLVIRLVRLVDEPERPTPLLQVPVPTDLDVCHPVVRALREAQDLLDVSDEAKSRALMIIQAIADECDRRGYEIGLPNDDDLSFEIAVGVDRFAFSMVEEFERREAVDPKKLAAAKYGWQRVPSTMQDVRSGRLQLRMRDGYRSVSWADRQRWSLEQKLPVMFAEVARRAADHAEERRRREDERTRRHRAWEEAVPRAKQAYIDELNRRRLREQVTRSADAAAIRDYCTRLEAVAGSHDDLGQAERIRAWAEWARREADRIDPVNDLDQLAYVTPGDVRPADFAEFMPRGMSAYNPPD